MAISDQSKTSLSGKDYIISISIIGVLFFIFGFVTWLNATLIPYLKIACELTSFEALLVTFAFYISYFVLAIPGAWVLKKVGFRNGMSLGLFTMAIGALVFIPAATTRMYGLFLTGLFIQGIGLTILQTASNPYVTILGPIESAAKRISIMGVANKIAGIISPAILGAIVLDGADDLEAKLPQLTDVQRALELDGLAAKVIWPYVIMAAVLVLLSIAVRKSALPEIDDEETTEESELANQKKHIFQFPYLILGVLAIFFYVGVEVIAVDTLISYGKDFWGFELKDAKFFASFTLIAMIVGYFFGIVAIPKYISQEKALTYFAILGIVFSILAVVTSRYGSITFIALLGFANSIMWPAIWPLAINGLGRFTKIGSAMLIMGILGGATLPPLYGLIINSESITAQQGYLILVPSYLFILFYAAKGYKLKSWKKLTFILLGALFVFISCNGNRSVKNSVQQTFQAQELFPEPPRPEGQTDVIELACEPIKTVRIGFIGLGMRGSQAIYRYTFIEGIEIKALCDVAPENVEKAQKTLADKGWPKADEYTGKEDWKKICERDDIDLIYVCTHWDLHTPIAVFAMEHGKHVVTEVPAALTIDECWQLVNTAERTQKHCMQLENCNYDFFEIATKNMADQGLFGEIVHCEGAYIHDLRWLNFDDSTGYWNMWRLKHLEKEDGNTYPTHGFGPIAHIMNIHRGDKLNYLTSMSTNQFGMTEYAKEKFGLDSEYAKQPYKKGDMNTTLIRTEKGKTILLQHDVTSPRPYSRLHTISGTKGFAQKYPVKGIALESNAHHFLPKEKMDSLLDEYTFPFVKEIEDKAREVGGHGGMDFIMDYRLIYCLHKGLPLDQDVYDAAEWSSVIELSRKSVENQSMPVKVPDFTRGAWKKCEQVKYYQ